MHLVKQCCQRDLVSWQCIYYFFYGLHNPKLKSMNFTPFLSTSLKVFGSMQRVTLFEANKTMKERILFLHFYSRIHISCWFHKVDNLCVANRHKIGLNKMIKFTPVPHKHI